KAPARASSSATTPSVAVATSYPAALRPFSTNDAIRVSSSATRMRGIRFPLPVERQRDHDARSRLLRIVGIRPAPVPCGDRGDDRQAETRARDAPPHLGAREPAEDPVELLGRD